MASNPFRHEARPMRAFVIRVTGPDGSPAGRFAVLTDDSGAAMAAVIVGLGLSQLAEVTDEILDPAVTAGLGLEPGRPQRLT